MRYLLWLLKFALFMLIVSFAVKNTETVTVRYYLGHEWQGPLLFVLLFFFVAGIVVGIVAILTHLFRLRREVAALKRELRTQARSGGDAPANPPDVE